MSSHRPRFVPGVETSIGFLTPTRRVQKIEIKNEFRVMRFKTMMIQFAELSGIPFRPEPTLASVDAWAVSLSIPEAD